MSGLRLTLMFRLISATPLLLSVSALSPACAWGSPADGETGEGDEGDEDGGNFPEISLRVNQDIDILFVIDNSGSMAEEQAALVRGISSFIEVLDHPDVRANYRIGVTTTDNGNPWCASSTPEAGSLIHSSCLDRIASFVSEDGQIDASAIAC